MTELKRSFATPILSIAMLPALSCSGAEMPPPAHTSPQSPDAEEAPAPPVATVLSEDPPVAAASEAPPAAAEHVCPMHSEVRQSGPGKCPKCGMDLVPAKKATSPGTESVPQDPHAGHAH
jgi:Cu+-exporting ATPase